MVHTTLSLAKVGYTYRASGVIFGGWWIAIMRPFWDPSGRAETNALQQGLPPRRA
jgi:hypothetical protein